MTIPNETEKEIIGQKISIDKEFYVTDNGLVIIITIEYRRESIERYFLLSYSFDDYEINQISTEMAFRLVRRKH